MDILEILRRHCPTRRFYEICLTHGKDVAGVAIELAQRIDEKVDLVFLEEAAILHDIGAVQTWQPQLGCNGVFPSFCHGFLGAEILRQEGLPRHANVCERHVGTGLTRDMIVSKNRVLPANQRLPVRDMTPQTIEEELICFVDCFFSKWKLGEKRSLWEAREKVLESGQNVNQFDLWVEKFLR
ncbi:MAG: HDIG domain-containing protein [Planctomycetia bacterium]|nr:HDIG domain-containing protein [Planctomycetia bacterium]